MIRFVFLDLDDTLLDFHKAEREALIKTLKAYGLPADEAILSRFSVINDEQWKRLERGELTRAQVKRLRFQLLFEEMGVQVDAENARRAYEDYISVGHWFLPGAEELLEGLHGNYRLFLVSNGTEAVQRGRLASAGIAPLFEGIFFSESVGYVKPEREFFDVCFAQISDFCPDEAIILGDSLTSDILGGLRAGIHTCRYNPHHQPSSADIIPEHEISELSDFLRILKHV